MRFFLKALAVSTLFFSIASCNYTTYRLHSKKRIQHEKPSVAILSRIVDFRNEQLRWPASREDFTSIAKKYRDVFEGFPYNYTNFKIKDNDNMTFYFSDHISDAQKYSQSQKVDLNGFHGTAKFYKKDGQFVWKLKMR